MFAMNSRCNIGLNGTIPVLIFAEQEKRTFFINVNMTHIFIINTAQVKSEGKEAKIPGLGDGFHFLGFFLNPGPLDPSIPFKKYQS
jgi:hypothetical protein